ncbi:hypothetical protein WS89_21235 [Burkholderia sp. MSMB1072]|nr:hypothetical protein WS89_21235 [Burkholderia sp. MSMB1072]KWO43496.1 hypothetical protein WT97_17320 [Burkholderia sp. MSMB1459WGS]
MHRPRRRPADSIRIAARFGSRSADARGAYRLARHLVVSGRGIVVESASRVTVSRAARARRLSTA